MGELPDFASWQSQSHKTCLKEIMSSSSQCQVRLLMLLFTCTPCKCKGLQPCLAWGMLAIFEHTQSESILDVEQ